MLGQYSGLVQGLDPVVCHPSLICVIMNSAGTARDQSLKFPSLLGSMHGVQGQKDSNCEYLNLKNIEYITKKCYTS